MGGAYGAARHPLAFRGLSPHWDCHPLAPGVTRGPLVMSTGASASSAALRAALTLGASPSASLATRCWRWDLQSSEARVGGSGTIVASRQQSRGLARAALWEAEPLEERNQGRTGSFRESHTRSPGSPT